MSNPSFSLMAEEMFEDLLDRLEGFEALDDLEMDIIDGVMTVEFDDGSKVILNRQEPVEQIWLASPEGPAHFSKDKDTGEWVNIKTGDEFYATLSRVFSAKTGDSIQLT
ncbi:MAG: iron donor protein CyaY [bacterium]